MNTKFKFALAIVASAALGATAMQGLRAQAKPKAYIVAEIETLDAEAQAVYGPLVQAAQSAAGGRNFNTAGGRIVALEGTAPPKRVALTEWDSLEQALAWRNSAAYKNLAPQGDKARNEIRAYAIEAVAN
jgi:uncharacterized protein (DUF1330 family)